MKHTLKNWIILVLILMLGVFIGTLIDFNTETPAEEQQAHTTAVEQQIWTCSMHPQVRKNAPGKCPLCGMDLIPLYSSDHPGQDKTLGHAVRLSPSAMKLAEVQTYAVKKQVPQKKLHLLGEIKPDERLAFSQTIHLPGRIEKLFINFTGEKVYKGKKIATIYSAELVTAQKELFEALRSELVASALVEAARNKLKQWKFTDRQIAELEKAGIVQTQVDILSNYSGYVMRLSVSEGDHVKEGQVLFEVTDLSKVWALFQVYEDDLPWIRLGDNIDLQVNALPGRQVRGKITFIDPFIDPKTRVVYARVELSNHRGLLKPDMFVNGVLTATLSSPKKQIMIPRSAILWTGKRAVVYVQHAARDDGYFSFVYREVVLGEDTGEAYVVKKGLKEGEIVVTNGVFNIDAAAQLEGKKSMINASEEQQKPKKHSHGS